MKKFREILSDMVTWISITNTKVTNFRVGSVIRSILEAVAIEIESLYSEIRRRFTILQENSIYEAFNFKKKPPIASTGMVTIKFVGPLTQSQLYPLGFRLYTIPIEGKTVYFETTSEIIANIGSVSVDLPVKCTEPGVVGNVPAYSIRRAVSSTPFVAELYNKDRFFTGAPEESKEERKKRFNAFLDGIGKCTNSAIKYGCSQVEGITGVHVEEGIGMIYVYAHDYQGNLSDTLKSSLDNALYNYRAGGIKPIIAGVTKKPINLNIKVFINQGYNKSAMLYKVQESVSTYLNMFTVSKNLTRADLIRHIMDIDRQGISNASIDLASDVLVQPQELIRAGIVTVTEM